jgi:hypothetical protein
MAAFTFVPNTTADIYRTGNAPPAAPDVPGVRCMLIPRFRNIKTTVSYDHIALFPLGTDIRDTDSFYIPTKNDTKYTIAILSRVRSGQDFKKVLASRGTPNYPTTAL